ALQQLHRFEQLPHTLAKIDLAEEQDAQRPFHAEGSWIKTLKGSRVSFVSKRDDPYLFRGDAFSKQCIFGPFGVDDDAIRKQALTTPVVPVFFGRFLIRDDSFLCRAGIDLAQHRAPATLARKLEDLARGVAVGKD